MDIYNKIANVSLQHFFRLPKTGKPTTTQWTILSTIVKEDLNTKILEVIALGTGTKCIGRNQMSINGDILNDSHAEIICRRSFLKYLYSEINNCIVNSYKSSIVNFDITTKKFSMKDNVNFHFFTTHVPCGDATIFSKELIGNENKNMDNECIEISVQNAAKKIKLDSNIADIYRTGAKCLPQCHLQDPCKDGINFHIEGPIRTKPGRGDPTLSVSCSDKIAKWCYLGIQGSLLSFLLNKPIYLKSFTVAGQTPFSKDALSRAITTRFEEVSLCSPFKLTTPTIRQSDFTFQFEKTDGKIPCPSSISWWKNIRKPEISVDGKKQGATKKTMSKHSRVGICKLELMRDFIGIAERLEISNINKTTPYCELKKLCANYQNNWNIVKNHIFKQYVSKDANLLCFMLD